MMLALRARVRELTAKDVEEAIAHSRSLVRTWTMRGTLHLLAAEDVGWLVDLLGPIFADKGKRRRLQLGLDDDLAASGLNAIRDVLAEADEPLTRQELVERLAERGIAVERRGQAPIHLIAYAAHHGVLCLGTDRPNGKSTYVLLDRWVRQRKSLPRDSALAEFARRYVAGYGPATPGDFASWSGLTRADARQGWNLIRDQLVEIVVENHSLWAISAGKVAAKSVPSASSVRLIPAFDTYILGYADRDYVVSPDHQRDVYHGGQTVPVVLVDGAAAGVWRYERRGKRLDITVRPFESFAPELRQLIREEADDIGGFWDVPVSLSIQ
jgi:Winged helix DNA-binding domain